MEKKLEARHRRFVEEYLLDLSQTQAAIRAGYSPASATSRASKLMARPDVKAAIEEAMTQRSRRVGINQNRVLTELAKLAFVNPADFMDLNTATVKENFTTEDAAAVAGVKYKQASSQSGGRVERNIQLHSKLKALELLGKHLGMFTDKLQVETDTTLNINVEGDFDEC